MQSMCAWCGRSMGTVLSGIGSETVITHGICEGCAAKFLGEAGEDLMTFLDRLDEPVVMIGSAGSVKTANRHARTLLQKDLPQIEGYKSGDVFECAYAKLPEGCGRTIHCHECAIRNAVADTFQSGRSHLKVLAHLHSGAVGDGRKIDLLISTEKVGAVVLLRVDKEGGPPAVRA